MTTQPEPSAPAGTRNLWAVTVAAILLSIGGVAYAALWGSAADGGRGGALAVALTFFMLFAGRGTAAAALDAELPAAATAQETLEQELARVRASLSALIDWSAQEKCHLTISSVFGTLVWGFGDLLAKAFGAP